MNASTRVLLILALVSLGAACGRDEPATSQSRTTASTAPAGQADQDRDGRVTRDEAETHPDLSARFQRHDTNRDGALDRGEFARLEAAERDQHQLRDTRDFPKEFD